MCPNPRQSGHLMQPIPKQEEQYTLPVVEQLRQGFTCSTGTLSHALNTDSRILPAPAQSGQSKEDNALHSLQTRARPPLHVWQIRLPVSCGKQKRHDLEGGTNE